MPGPLPRVIAPLLVGPLLVTACLAACAPSPASKSLAATKAASRGESPDPGPAPVEIYFVSASPLVAWQHWRHLAAIAMPGAEQSELPEVAATMLGPGLSQIIDWNAPAAAAIAGESEQMVFAVELFDLEKARRSLEKEFALSKRGSRWAFVVKGEEDEGDYHCELWPIEGRPRPLLICAPSVGFDLRAYAPGLAQQIARTAGKPYDIGMTMDGALASVTREMAAEQTATTNPAEAIGQGIAVEMFRGIRSLAVGITRAESFATVHLDMTLPRDPPITTSALIGEAGEPAPLSALSRLPADSELAFASSGFSPNRDRSGFLDLLRKAFDALPQSSVPKEGKEPLVQATSKLMLTGGPWVMGYGADVDSADRALSSSPADPARALAELRKAANAWHLFGVVEPGQEYVKRLRQLFDLDVRFAADGGKKGEPSKDAGGKRPSQTTIIPIPTRYGLPAGSIHAIRKKDGVTQHIFVAPEPDRAWFAIGEDEKRVLDKLQAVLRQDIPCAEVPAAKPSRGQPNIAGHFTLAAFPMLMAPENLEELADLSGTLRTLRMLPRGGRQPLPFSGTTRRDEKTGELAVQIEVKIAEELLMAAITQLMADG